jgi:hypothetical protein
VVELGGTTGTAGGNPTSPERATDETWSVALSGLGNLSAIVSGDFITG